MKKKPAPKKKAKPRAIVPKKKNYIYHGGRPTLYDSSVCEKLVAHMAGGRSFDSFAGTLGISRDTAYEWVKVHKEFSDAKAEGQAQRILWTENLYLETMNPKRKKKFWVNTYLLGFYTKNVLNWADNVKHQGDAEKPVRVLTLAYKPDATAET